ncbi:unnamed protein product [Kuraishia capsulata CBS 1993]|uniref:NADH-cytochrome b5 reductase n=1 Tax=Kuraishia capsulata CBS 1993 TaxID=1382522 RepID=W6MQM2_9ASCO|nr:uncharacterized protein KUCA_T00004622001 [Kuraishia capsulata CBS 1993]CDK28638.1 unnamed protein product [Kuraishia capsulata CBS 1993]
MSQVKDTSHLLKTPLHGIVIPSCLILFGVGVHDWRYVPYAAVGLAIFLSIRMFRAYLRRKSLHPEKWKEFELIDKTVISKNSAIYRFKLYSEAENLDIPVGHHVACKVPIDGKDEIRFYTPVSGQYDEGFFDILVKSYKDGTVSKYFAGLKEGQSVSFRGPVGRMAYRPNMARKIGMIAGGSGITPLLQVMSYITTTPEDLTEVSLLFANETENDILLRQELDSLAAAYPNFKVAYTLTHPPANWEGETGYITKEMFEKYMPAASEDTKIFVCGPMPMKKLIIELAESVGFAKGVYQSKQDDQVFCF